jgi:G3E family GTPase
MSCALLTHFNFVPHSQQLQEEATANRGTVTQLASTPLSFTIVNSESLTFFGYLERQIAVADSLCLSKIDLVPQSKLEPLKKLIS